ncbi:unnamed protein product, partial [Urochloa humidicola]
NGPTRQLGRRRGLTHPRRFASRAGGSASPLPYLTLESHSSGCEEEKEMRQGHHAMAPVK